MGDVGHTAMQRSRSLALGAFFALLAALLVAPWPPKWGSEDGTCPLGYGADGGGGESGLPSPHSFHSPRSGSSSSSGSSSNGVKARGSSPSPRKLLLFSNATVWTGARQASALHAEALLVDSATGRFAFVGSAERARRAAHEAAAAGGTAAAAEVEAVDLQGAHVIPGLIDSHLHLIPGGLSLSRLDLSAAAERGHFVAAVAAAATALRNGGAGRWLLGAGWDESRWGGELPSAAWIDDATPGTPVLLMRHDAHMALASSAALQLAGVGPATADPPGGSIIRAPDGRPTGLLTDAAIQLVSAHIPALSVEERRGAFDAAVQHALSLGITMVMDMGRIAFLEGEDAAWQDLEEVYVPAANEGRLPLRLYSFVPLTTWRRMAERVKHLGTAHPGGYLFWGGVKEFADGSLGSRTALFHEPYADQPGSSGTRTVDTAALRSMVAAADAAGLQVAVHAIGDRAVDEVLDMYAELAANRSASSSVSSDACTADSGGSSGKSCEPGSQAAEQQQQQRQKQGQQQQQKGQQQRQRRHRIEHAQHIGGPSTARRMAAAGVVATPNPQHLVADRGVLHARLGPERAGAGRTYAFRTLLQAGVTAAFGSDWPVVPLDPLAGAIYAAVHRRAPGSGDEAWAPAEALSTAEALAAHTREGAAAAGLEAELGTLEAGKLADFVVLTGPPGDAVAEVQQTFVGGRCRHGCAANG